MWAQGLKLLLQLCDHGNACLIFAVVLSWKCFTGKLHRTVAVTPQGFLLLLMAKTIYRNGMNSMVISGKEGHDIASQGIKMNSEVKVNLALRTS